VEPPVGVTVAVPLLPALQLTAVTDVVSVAGGVTVTVAVAVFTHPAAVVPVTV
jgi:hypothetical protein